MTNILKTYAMFWHTHAIIPAKKKPARSGARLMKSNISFVHPNHGLVIKRTNFSMLLGTILASNEKFTCKTLCSFDFYRLRSFFLLFCAKRWKDNRRSMVCRIDRVQDDPHDRDRYRCVCELCVEVVHISRMVSPFS